MKERKSSLRAVNLSVTSPINVSDMSGMRDYVFNFFVVNAKKVCFPGNFVHKLVQL